MYTKGPKISPRASSLAQQNQIDISKITPTGPDGRIIERDILRELEKKYMADSTDTIITNETKEVVEEVVAEETVEEAATEEVMEEITSEEVAEEIATEEPVEEIKTEEVVEEIATEETVEEAATEEVMEEITSEEIAEEIVTEESVEEIKTEEVVEEIATEEPVEEIKTEEVVEEIATEETVEEAATEEVMEEITSEEVAEEIATEEPVEEITTEEVAEEIATEEPVEEIKTEEVVEEIATEETVEEAATEEVAEEVTTEEKAIVAANVVTVTKEEKKKEEPKEKAKEKTYSFGTEAFRHTDVIIPRSDQLPESTPMTITMSFDASAIVRLHQSIKENGEAMGLPHITINDMILFAVAKLLKKNKILNAHFLGDKIRYFDGVHLGFVVDTGHGVETPTVFDADRLSLSALSKITGALIRGARAGNVSPEKNKLCGSFMITNPGMIGVESFTPALTAPQTGSLGVCALQRRIKTVDGKDIFYSCIPLTLTFDPRALDMASAAKFLRELCTSLENFELLLIK